LIRIICIQKNKNGTSAYLQVACQLNLPLVTVGQQLLLVVQKLLVCLCGVLVVRSLDNSINRAGLLAETAVNALGHVNIVTGRATGSILTGLSLNGNGLGGADGLTKLTGNAALLSYKFIGITRTSFVFG
jgi:hypothetical protein